MTDVHHASIPATWRGLTAVDAATGCAGLSFDIAGSAPLRLRMTVADLRQLSTVLTDVLDRLQVEKQASGGPA